MCHQSHISFYVKHKLSLQACSFSLGRVLADASCSNGYQCCDATCADSVGDSALQAKRIRASHSVMIMICLSFPYEQDSIETLATVMMRALAATPVASKAIFASTRWQHEGPGTAGILCT